MAGEGLLLSCLLSDFYQVPSLSYDCGSPLLPEEPCLAATETYEQGVSQACWTHTM